MEVSDSPRKGDKSGSPADPRLALHLAGVERKLAEKRFLKGEGPSQL
jgi:hypothetical protein